MTHSKHNFRPGADPEDKALSSSQPLCTGMPESSVHALQMRLAALEQENELLRQAQEAQLRSLSDNLPNAVVYQATATPDGGRRFTYISRGVERLNELTVGEVLADALVIYRQILPEYQILVANREEEALRTLSTLRVEVQSRLPSGRLRWFAFASTPRYLDDGLLVWDGVEVDITERKEIEENLERIVEERTAELTHVNRQLSLEILKHAEASRKLAEHKAMLVEAQHISHVGSWHWDMASDRAEWSEEFYAIAGISPASEPPGLEKSEQIFTPDSWQQLVHAINRSMQEGAPYELALQLARPDGELRDVICRGRTKHNSEGSVAGLYGTVQDVTEWMQSERERRSLEAQVQYAQKLESLGILAGGIAHDFNNILQIILGNVKCIQQLLFAASPMKPYVENIANSVNRAAMLTRKMLAYSGKGRICPDRLQLGELVRDITHLIQSSASKKVVWRLDLPDGLPCIEADAAQMQQVVMNLVLNATESLDPDSGGTVSISTKAGHYTSDMLRNTLLPDELAAGEYACLEVTDTGCGMTEETRNKLFDPFFTTKFTGRGLGMSAVLGILRGHKGAIFVDSVPGSGTTIRVLLPVAQSVSAPDSNADQKIRSEFTGEDGSALGTLLFVDDEPEMLEVGAMMLQQMGYAVYTAADGMEALRIFEKHAGEIVCVLLDLSMPRMDGTETLRELRRIRADIPVILASGFAEQELQARFAGQDIQAFLSKPYDFSALRKNLRLALRR